jgi:hypothetical protein
VAPAEIAPGESAQLVANAVKSDGTVENVTTQSQWTPVSSTVLAVSGSGLVTARARGEQFVSARYSTRTASARILVLPKGTYRLGGSVREAGFPISNATVTVISGVETGLSTISGFEGFYSLYGVSGPVQIQIKKEGYLNRIESVDVNAHKNVDFQIVAERARADYRGLYTLTISAASPCRFTTGIFPDSARRRTYAAAVAQDGPGIRVTLGDADFIVANGRGNGFSGFIDPTDAITFLIGDNYYYYYYSGVYDIVERFETTALIISGSVSSRGSPGSISGTMTGNIMVTRTATPPFFLFSGRCYSDSHRFEMTRR